MLHDANASIYSKVDWNIKINDLLAAACSRPFIIEFTFLFALLRNVKEGCYDLSRGNKKTRYVTITKHCSFYLLIYSLTFGIKEPELINEQEVDANAMDVRWSQVTV